MQLLRVILSLLPVRISLSASSGSLYLFFVIAVIHLDYSYSNVLNYLQLHAFSARRRYLDVLF